MTFNRPAFERQVAERSPLTCSQFEHLLGGTIDATNKAVAWQLLQLPHRWQYAVWQVIKECPGAEVTRAGAIERVR